MFIHRYHRLWFELVRRLASEGQFSAYGEVLCRILDMDFGEFHFYHERRVRRKEEGLGSLSLEPRPEGKPSSYAVSVEL
jgi:hypothetical protein